MDRVGEEDVVARRRAGALRPRLVVALRVLALGLTVAVAVWGRRHGVVAAVVAPLAAGGCAYGIAHGRVRRASRQLARERVLVAALERRLEELSSLLDGDRVASAALDLSEVVARVLENAVDLLSAADGSVLLVEEPGMLRTVCASGDEHDHDAVVGVGEGIAGRVAANREPLLVQRSGQRSSVCVPLVRRGALLGVLNVNGRSGRGFDEHDLEALRRFGEHAASSIANARIHEAERANAIALARRGLHDPLTDLANRPLFAERLARRLSSERLQPVAVLFVDLDDFAKVNDTLGVGVGDQVLCRIADRVTAGLREQDVAARVGGDELAVLLDDVPSAEEALRMAEELLLRLSDPIDVGDLTVTVRASVGVAVGQAGVSSTDELLRNADVAMYVAKAQGMGCVRLFEPAMHTAILERLELEAQLEVAVERAQLDLRYQPIVSLATGRVHGFEALVRWNHPERGELPPDAFLPLAEEAGLVVGIDRWVLLKACCQGQTWQRAYPADEPLMVAVKLSTRQLEEADVVELVQLSLEVSGLPAAHLVIQVTEDFLLGNEEAGLATLEALRGLGVRLAIDEFGTGYSSLSHLRQLPIDVLKIDRSFTDRLGRSEEDTALLGAILRLARSLDLETIAEGVERPEQRAALADLQCGLAQGWHIARPLLGAEMEDLLRTRTSALSLRV